MECCNAEILGCVVLIISSLLIFRPKKSAPSGSKVAQLRKHIDATLSSENLRGAVRLPPSEDINEWLATHISWSYGVERISRFPSKLLEARNVQMTALRIELCPIHKSEECFWIQKISYNFNIHL